MWSLRIMKRIPWELWGVTESTKCWIGTWSATQDIATRTAAVCVHDFWKVGGRQRSFLFLDRHMLFKGILIKYPNSLLLQVCSLYIFWIVLLCRFYFNWYFPMLWFDLYYSLLIGWILQCYVSFSTIGYIMIHS